MPRRTGSGRAGFPRVRAAAAAAVIYKSSKNKSCGCDAVDADCDDCCCGCDDDYREDCDNDDFNDIPADKAEDVGVVSDACACTEEEIFDKAEDAVESDEV